MAVEAPAHAISSEDEAMILEVVRDLVAEKVAPRAAEIDESGEFPWDVQKLFAQNDLLGIPFPAEYGGLGGSFVTYVKVVEEVAKACASSSLIIAVQELGALPILIAGQPRTEAALHPEARQRRVDGSLRADRGGKRFRRGRLDALPRRNARATTYVLNGTKIWITQGSVADVVCVFAVTDPSKGPNGISAFVVEKNFPGFKVGKLEKKMGIRGSPTVELDLRELRGPGGEPARRRGDRIQDRDERARQIAPRDRGAGGRDRGTARSTTRPRTRASAWRSASRSASSRACSSCSPRCGRRSRRRACCSTKSARKCDQNADDITLWAAMAKLKAGDVAMSVTTDAVQILGGFGYSTEYPTERMMRDAKITQIYEGTQQIQRLVIARTMVGKWKPPATS